MIINSLALREYIFYFNNTYDQVETRRDKKYVSRISGFEVSRETSYAAQNPLPVKF